MRTRGESKRAPNPRWVLLGALLLAIGLLGHVLAAHGTGGRAIDYRHHITGFLALTAVSGVIAVLLSLRFWRGRHDITLLIVGALQGIIGAAIYLDRFRVAANW